MSDDYDGPPKEQLKDLERPVDRDWYIKHGGLPYRRVGTLETMRRKGTITEAQHAAGLWFGQDFNIAGLDPLHAPDMGRIPGQGWDQEVKDRAQRASNRNYFAMKALGTAMSPAGSCAWHVLGLGDSLKRWAKEYSQHVGERQASGVLVAALGMLVEHYRQGSGER